jgi:hypothetical protein
VLFGLARVSFGGLIEPLRGSGSQHPRECRGTSYTPRSCSRHVRLCGACMERSGSHPAGNPREREASYSGVRNYHDTRAGPRVKTDSRKRQSKAGLAGGLPGEGSLRPLTCPVDWWSGEGGLWFQLLENQALWSGQGRPLLVPPGVEERR